MQVFIARQPILDRLRRTVAYELLFRSGLENAFPLTDSDLASQKVVSNTVHVFGINALTGGKPAFVNMTREFLLKGFPFLLPPNLLVVELSAKMEEVNGEVLKACQELKRSGYLIALDDFSLEDLHSPLLPFVDILKVDFVHTVGRERWQIAKRFSGQKLRLLAERVETHEDFEEAVGAGYGYFQGFFFCHPEILTGRDLPSYKLTHLRIMQELCQPTVEFQRLEAILKGDLSLSFKLLRYVNAAAIGLRYSVTSLQQAMVLLGELNLRRWLLMTLATSLLEDKPPELLKIGVVRGQFCVLVCQRLQWRALGVDPFLVGFLSVLDALVGRPLSELLKELPIAAEIQDALLGRPTLLGNLLHLAIACERAEWEKVTPLATSIGLSEEELAHLYSEAIRQAEQMFQANNG